MGRRQEKKRQEREAASTGRRRHGNGGGERGNFGSRDAKCVVLVVVEGEGTEMQYIKWLNVRADGVKIKSEYKNSDPLNMVEHAIQRRAEGPAKANRPGDGSESYDAVWCLMDVDTHERLPAALRLAKKESVDLVVSTVCFETWLLMHLREVTTPYAEAGDEKKDWAKISGGENKSEDSRLGLLAGNLPAALKRARSSCAREKDPFRRNPGTNMHEFIEDVARITGVKPENLYDKPTG